MSKMIHFQDQLVLTSNPDPLLKFYEEYDGSDGIGPARKLQMDVTRKSQLHDQLVGMKFVRMVGNYPVFINELVDA